MSRRAFVAQSAAATAGLSVAKCFPEVGGRWLEPCPEIAAPPPGLGTSDVVEVHDMNSVSADAPFSLQPATIATMLTDGLHELTGVGSPWTAILPDYQPGMRIGLKVNCLNSMCPTSTVLTRADGLSDEGEGLGVLGAGFKALGQVPHLPPLRSTKRPLWVPRGLSR